ncbi:FAD-dependent monooxygenase [Polaromonas sp. SM01]|uniref:FAD-dependent monooxygenase n=1 Tax=Polaromonas sp. SM01 TaxID=3085630 RepID=UPI0029828A7E|nr:FAD-dependent monooxygenase [Polaromonas sp. SM01]MDW5443560.1 FAD-dependent monooxygenase [Polaromonas sp. SM01]
MSKPFDVCIRGGGVVGRTLALLLARERLRVALVARPQAATPAIQDVRAYALNSASRQLLESLRAWPEAPFATPVQAMRVWGDDGGQLDFAPEAGRSTALAWIVDVPALEQQLAEAVYYQSQIETVMEPVKATLSVICEGKHSSSRNEFGAAWTVKPYQQKAIAARLSSDQPHHGVARQWFCSGDILALLPMGGVEGNSMALVWSVSVERAAALEKLSPEEFAAALQAVCGDEAGQLQLNSALSSWPLSLSKAERWVGPGWALAGDAAHTVHPLAGQGLNLGLADAAGLAAVVHEREYWRGLGDEKLLRRYERARKADVAAMGAVTDGLHGLFAQSDVRWQALRNWGMKGFARSGPLKTWVTRQAMGL